MQYLPLPSGTGSTNHSSIQKQLNIQNYNHQAGVSNETKKSMSGCSIHPVEVVFLALHQGVQNQLRIVHRQIGIIAKHVYLLVEILIHKSFLLSLVNHCSLYSENECTLRMYVRKVIPKTYLFQGILHHL